MGLIKDAIVGVALYKAIGYLFTIKATGVSDDRSVPTSFSTNLNREALAQTEQPLISSEIAKEDLDEGLIAGSNPEIPLTGDGSLDIPDETWKNSLADDQLRAPDS